MLVCAKRVPTLQDHSDESGTAHDASRRQGGSLKILIASSVFPPIATGSSFYSRNLAEAFFMAGHEVSLVTLNKKGCEVTTEKFDVHVLNSISLNLKKYFKHFGICSFFPENYSKISEIISLGQKEIVLLINHYSDIAFPVIYAAKRHRVPLVLSIGTQIQSTDPLRNKALSFLDKLICGRLIIPECDCIISWDKEIDRYVRNSYKSEAHRSIIVPFGVSDEKDCFLDYQHPYDSLTQITGVGAVIDQRNYIFQIRVFKELLKTFPSMKMKIIGHIYRDDAVKEVKAMNLDGKVIFTGELKHEEAINEIKKSALHWMMLSGEYRGLGTSNAEAMLLGVPVVSNIPEDLFGKDRLEDMKHFIYTDGISIKPAADKIINVLQDEELRRQIGTSGKRYIKSHLNWRVILDKMTLLFDNVITNHQYRH